MKMASESQKKFKILSIDGGGIRGILPLTFLANLEQQLKSTGNPQWKLHNHFDLICGTSTGGIISLAISLGIPTTEILDLYFDNAKKIFHRRFNPLKPYSNSNLQNLIREKFQDAKGRDQLMKDCKTATCITSYNLFNGSPNIHKSAYHENWIRDPEIPAYQIALSTSAAPTFFKPYNSEYKDGNQLVKKLSNMVDGGVYANNPTLIGIIEATEVFEQPLSNLKILSLGTGHKEFTNKRNVLNWGKLRWINKGRIIDLFMQGQSQHVENLISIMQLGPDKIRYSNPTFIYDRLNINFDKSSQVKLNETNASKLKKLKQLGDKMYYEESRRIIETYCDATNT